MNDPSPVKKSQRSFLTKIDKESPPFFFCSTPKYFTLLSSYNPNSCEFEITMGCFLS